LDPSSAFSQSVQSLPGVSATTTLNTALDVSMTLILLWRVFTYCDIFIYIDDETK
jgi:hypothetical protein